MTYEDFKELVSAEHTASCDILTSKASEYGSETDRLSNFKNAAGLRATNSVDSLMGMLVKHFESVSTMAKNPTLYDLKRWDEKLRDIRNYTYLCKGLLIDLEGKS